MTDANGSPRLVAPTRIEGFELDAPTHGVLRNRILEAPQRGQVLLELRMTGVCASELYDWINPPGQLVPVGHEPVGEVVAVGEDVALRVGELVTGRVVRSFAPFVIADELDLVVVPPTLPAAEVLGEPVACVVEALRRSRVQNGDRVAVVGTGYMGLVMTQLLAHSLASSVLAIDPRADARAAALENGADSAIEPTEAAGLSDSIDVVIEATGSASGLDLASHLVREHGTLSVMGYHRTPRTVDMQQWNFKAIDVVNAHVRDRRLLREATRVGLELQAAGRIDPGRLITHHFRPDEVNRAFEVLRDKPPGFIKAVIDYAQPA